MPAWTWVEISEAGMRAVLSRALASAWAKPLWFAVSLLPFLSLFARAWLEQLGANPAETLIRSTGDWTLRALCLVLAITPLRKALRLPALARMRRMAGLFVYFYALLHLLAYSWLDRGLDLADIARDIVKRPFIWVGFAAWVVLTPLALTSWNRAIQAMGPRRWQALHRLVYAVAAMAVLHFYWMRAAKNNWVEVAWYAALLTALLAYRVGSRLAAKPRS